MQPGLATYVVMLTFGTALAAILATLAWSRRTTPGAVPFALAMVAVMTASMSRIVFSVGAVEMAYFWARLRIVALLFVPAFALMFVLAYVGRRKWARFPRAWAFLVVPILLSFAIWTHDHWFWTDWHISEVTNTRSEVFTTGLLWGVNLLYAYSCFIVLLGLLVKSPLLEQLRSLTLRRCHLQDPDLDLITTESARFKHLARLDLRDNMFSRDAVRRARFKHPRMKA